jgi:1-acyl-sn-glycerol-3-phosphate acyltransferase
MSIIKIGQSIGIRIISHVSAVFIKSFWLGKIEGINRIPSSPCIIISNHESYLDFLLLGYALKKKANKNFRFWAKSKVVKHVFWKTYSNIFNSIEVNENGNYRNLNELSLQALSNGDYVCIFPEGRRSRDGELQKFKEGYLHLASAHGIEVVPAFLENTFETWPTHKRFPGLKRCNITFHQPIKISKNLTDSETDEVNRMFMKKYESIKRLSDHIKSDKQQNNRDITGNNT